MQTVSSYLNRLVNQGEVKKAIAVCQRKLLENKYDHQILFFLGKLCALEGHLQECAIFLHKAHHVAPKNVEYLMFLGEVLGKLNEHQASMTCFQKVIDIDVNNVEAHNNLAFAYSKFGGKLNEAIAHLEHAASLRPESAEIKANLAALYHEAGNYGKAVSFFDAALGIVPDQSTVLVGKAGSLMCLKRIDDAIECYEAAAEADPSNIDAKAGKCGALEKLGRIDEARELAESFLKEGLNPVFALISYATICSDERRPWLIEKFNTKLRDGSLLEMDRRKLNFSLGKLYEKEKDFENAFRSYERGNKLKNLEYSEEGDTQKMEISSNFEWKPGCSSTSSGENAIFIVGLPRCGSTLLDRVLSWSPQVKSLGESDLLTSILLTSKPYPQMTSDDFTVMADRYMASAAANGRKVVNKSLSNYMLIQVIRQTFPCCEIIHCERHPLDQCLSIFFQDFVGRHSYAYSLRNIASHFKKYKKVMGKLDEKGADIFTVRYEDMILDPEATSKKVFDRCGIEWSPECVEVQNRSGIVHTASYQQVRNPIYKDAYGKYKNYIPFIKDLMDALEEEAMLYELELM